MFGNMFKSTPVRSVDVGSGTDEDVLAGEQIGENTAMQLLEDMTEATGDVERSLPASHSTPKTSPPPVPSTSPVQGYQQPDDPLNIRGAGVASSSSRIDPLVVENSASMSAGQRADDGLDDLERKMDELLRRHEDLHVRFTSAPTIIDYAGATSRPASPPKVLPVPTPYPSRTYSSEDRESARAEGARRYQSFLEDFSLGDRTATAATPVIHCVIKPKKFDGTNWPGYRLHFMSCAQANGWAPQQSALVLKACLNENAALFLRRNLRRQDATLEEIFQCLDERYCAPGPEYVLRGKLRRLTQRPDQSVSSYQLELMALMANRADVEESAWAVEQFIYGLNDTYMQKYVAKRCPADLHDALTYAKAYEEMNSWLKGEPKKVNKRVCAVTAVTDQAAAAVVNAADPDEPKDELTALREEMGALRSRMKYWRDQCWRGRGRGRGRGRHNGGHQRDGDQEHAESHPADQASGQPPASAAPAATAAPATQN